MKLLIVDDQRSVHLYLQKAIDLPALGFSEVLHAESGTQALELLRRCHPDVMILDIQMPDMNGIALLEVLQQEKIVRPETVVLTAYDEFLYAKRCIDFGVRRYVLKPIDAGELTLILCETYQAIYQQRLESYRWAFPLLCSHLNDNFDMSTLQVRYIDSLLYGVICISERNDKHAAVTALEAISRCTVDGLTMLLISVPSQKIWERTISKLSDAFGAEELPAGVSDLRTLPDEMPLAVREAVQRMWQNFYICSVRSDASAPPFGAFHDGLQMTGDFFLQEDSAHLTEMVEQVFLCFCKDNAAPDAVINACRKLLARICADHCSERAADLNSFPGTKGFLTANQLQKSLINELIALRQHVSPAAACSEEEIINRVRSYVDAHYSEDLSLSTIAAKFYISRYQVSRLFKQLFGVNYQDYVLSVRMKVAAHLLRHTNMRLYEISSTVGFDESSYFSNVFKKTYGCNPRAYRMEGKRKSGS